MTSCVRDTKASSEYIFSKAHPYIEHICVFQQSGNNISNINSVKLFIKLLFHHLEHLDSLGERHANRLNSWVGCTLSLPSGGFAEKFIIDFILLDHLHYKIFGRNFCYIRIC